jgi:alkylresorcinol/alkylpyrone synthase
MNRIPFSRNLRRVPIFGLGCAGGAAGIARASDYVLAHPDQLAILLSVELCSLTWQRNDLSTANIISTALFGDGAAAVVLAGAQVPITGPTIVSTESVFYPDTEELMGWDISETGLRIVLSPDVPKICLENLGADVDRFLQKHDLKRKDISQWIMHTGGPKVLEAMQQSLSLPRSALHHSWQCLRKVGNLSSASVIVVLDDIMKNSPPPEGTWSVLAAMGPGFCAELVLIRW